MYVVYIRILKAYAMHPLYNSKHSIQIIYHLTDRIDIII